MLSKIRALKEKKGFTLVELIVVLVILAILAALLIPALTGYIDKARKESIVASISLEVRLSSIVDGELARAAQINARCACAFAGMDAIVPVGMAFVTECI